MEKNYQKAILTVLTDPEVQANLQLHQLFTKALTDLNKDRSGLVMARLIQGISLYLMNNRYQAPKSVLDFAQTHQKALPQERGLGSALRMLALSIRSLK